MQMNTLALPYKPYWRWWICKEDLQKAGIGIRVHYAEGPYKRGYAIRASGRVRVGVLLWNNAAIQPSGAEDTPHPGFAGMTKREYIEQVLVGLYRLDQIDNAKAELLYACAKFRAPRALKWNPPPWRRRS